MLSFSPVSDVSILVGDTECRNIALWSQTTFDSSAGAQPGTCRIVVREPGGVFNPGDLIVFTVDGVRVWMGFAMTITYGSFFPSKIAGVRQWIIGGVDLNILFDKFFLYNRVQPNLALFNNQPYPANIMDREVLRYHLTNDCDLDKLTIPDLDYISGIEEIGQVNENGKKGTPIFPGSYLRALFADIAQGVNTLAPGSVIFYWGPDGRLIYTRQDHFLAPFGAVSDNSTTDVSCQNLSMMVADISHLKNMVMVIANALNYDLATIAADKQKPLFNWVLEKDEESIAKYGMWQYPQISPDYSVASLKAWADKIIVQEGTIPAQHVEFDLLRPGLLPGMILDVASDSFGTMSQVPIRSVSVSFKSPRVPVFHVVGSFDTNDPWGLLLALKRPATRGFVQPRFMSTNSSDWVSGAPAPTIQGGTSVTELRPNGIKSLSPTVFQLAYAYIRFSVFVYNQGKVMTQQNLTPGVVFDFEETDPDNGIITFMQPPTDGGDHLEIRYMASHNLVTEPV